MIRIVQNRVPFFGGNAFAETVRIEIRPAHHRQDGAGIRIDGHDGRTGRFDSFSQHDVQLFFDRVFRNLLQPRIDGEMNGFPLNARHAFDIANGTPRRIDFDVARSVFPFQVAIVRIFQTGTTHDGRRLIRISVRIHIVRPRFADVTQDVRRDIMKRIVAERLNFNFHIREILFLLFNHGEDVQPHIRFQDDGRKCLFIVFDFLCNHLCRKANQIADAKQFLQRNFL